MSHNYIHKNDQLRRYIELILTKRSCFVGLFYFVVLFLTNTTIAQTCQAPNSYAASIVNNSNTSVTISWPSLTGVTGYFIHYKPDNPNATTWTADYSNSASITLSGLSAGTDYVYTLRTKCGTELSAFSYHAFFTTTSGCGAPTGTSITNIGTNSFTMSWQANGASESQVWYKPKYNSTTWSLATTTTNSETITGLSSNTIYEAKVRSRCNGVWTDFSILRTLSTTGTGLLPPTNLRYLYRLSSGSVRFNWDEAANATGYTIAYRQVGSTIWDYAIVGVNSNGINLSQSTIDLLPNTDYEWKVLSRDDPDFSAYSAVQTFNTGNTCYIPNPYISLNGYAVAGSPVQFNDINGNGVTTFNWSFFGGTPSTGSVQTPSTVYSSPGEYTVSIATSNSCGTSATEYYTFNVAPNQQVAQTQGTALQQISPKKLVGDPINPITGALHHLEQDIGVKSANGFHIFKRLYFSEYDNYVGPFGANWTHNFNIELTKVGDILTLRNGEGATFEFFEYPDGTIMAMNHGVQDTMYQGAYGTYILEKRDISQMKYVFDNTFTLTHILDKHENAILFEYLGGNISKITFPGGRYLQFSYLGSRINQIEDQSGRSITYTYSGNNLVSSTSLIGGNTQYLYNGARMTTLITPTGDTAFVNTYDGQGRIINQKDAYQGEYQFAYYTDSTVITDPLGNVSVQRFDSNRRLVSWTDEEGYTTRLEYHPRFHQIKYYINPDGDSTYFKYHPTRFDLTEVYSPEGIRVYKSHMSAIHEPYYVRDALNYSVNFSWIDNKLTQITDPNSNTMSFAFDLEGQLEKITNARGFETSFVKDTTGDLRKRITPTGADSLITNTIGDIIGTINSLGQQTNVQVNAIGRLQKAFFHFGDSLRIDYNLNGQDTLIIYNGTDSIRKLYDRKDRLNEIIDHRGISTKISFTLLDQVDSILFADGSYVHYVYFKNGWIENEISSFGSKSYTRNGLGLPLTITNSLGQTTSITYNKDGDVLSITTPEGNTTTYNFDDRKEMTSIEDANNRITYFDVGDAREFKKVIDPEGGSTDVSTDQNYNITNVEDAKQQNTNFVFDASDRRTKKYLANGDSLTWTYDALDRVTQKGFQDGSTVDIVHDRYGDDSLRTYNYTGAIYKTLKYPNGDIQYAIRNTDTTRFFHNQFGIYKTIDDNGFALNYLFDPLSGKQTGIVYPSGDTVKWFYTNGRLSEVKDWLGNWVKVHYNSESWIDSLTYNNGLRVHYTYDMDGRLTGCSTYTNDMTLSDQLTLDDVGQVTQNISTKPLEAAYTNRQMTYNPNVQNAYETDGGITWETDQNGSVTSRFGLGDSLTITREEEAIASAIHLNGTDILQTTNAVRSVSRRNINGVTEKHARDQISPYHSLYEVRDNNDILLKQYVNLGVGPAWEIDSSGRVRYYVFDYQGNTRAMVDTAANITDSIGMDEFGDFSVHLGEEKPRFTYQAKYGVEDFGEDLYFTPFRIYSGKDGRFLSEDPIAGDLANTQSLNAYTYGLNNPISFTDPLGLSPVSASLFSDYKVFGDRVFIGNNNGKFNFNGKRYFEVLGGVKAFNGDYGEGHTHVDDQAERLIDDHLLAANRRRLLKDNVANSNRGYEINTSNIAWVYNESGSGDIDFKFFLASETPDFSEDPVTRTLYLVDNYYMNVNTFGNYLWGAYGATLNVQRSILISFAHAGSLREHGRLDEPHENMAIRMGYDRIKAKMGDQY